MKSLIFSDVHLDVADPEGMGEFTEFLNQIDPNIYPRIIILGDLFDFWFEYRHVVFSGYFDVLRALARLNDAGVDLHLVCGNHDFWGGPFLTDTLGFTVHEEPFTMDFDGHTAFLAHGDGINPDDRLYRLYKRVARARGVIALFRLLHPDWAMGLARWVSKTSRRHTTRNPKTRDAEAAALAAHARTVLEDETVEAAIYGHAHVAAAAQGYFNTGDWRREKTAVIWDGTCFRLLKGLRDIIAGGE